MTAALSLVAIPAHATHSSFVDKAGRGSIELVSVDSHGSQHQGDSGESCRQSGLLGGLWDGATMSADGRYVAFTSSAPLTPADTNVVLTDVYLRDRKTGSTTLVSGTPLGVAPQVPKELGADLVCASWSFGPSISGDGRYLAFVSYADLTEGDVSAKDPLTGLPFLKVYVRDLRNNTTELVSKAWDGKVSLGNAGMKGVTISRDGRVVSFISDATDLVEGQDTKCAPSTGGNLPCRQAYAFDRRSGKAKLVSISLDGKLADNEVIGAEVSGNGRYVMFDTPASNVIEGDDNICARFVLTTGLNCSDVFLRDLVKDRTELISVGLDGTSANDASYRMSGPDPSARNLISSNGRYVLFDSSATDLVPAGPSGGTYVRDRKTGRTERVSVTSDGKQLSGTFESMSEDGRFIMQYDVSCFFLDCVGDQHTIAGTTVYDRWTGQTDLVKLNRRGIEAINDIEDLHPTTAISSTGRYFVWTTTATNYVADDKNGDDADVFIRDLGIPRLGSLPKNMSGYARISDPEDRRFTRTGMLQLGAGDSGSPVATPSEVLSGRLVYRPELNDIYIRLEVDGVDLSTLSSPSLYGVSFEAADVRYEVRALPAGVTRIGLFRCAPLCSQVRTLEGNYGVTGRSIVATIPLDALGLEDGGRIEGAQTFSGVGSFETTGSLLDEIASQ